MPRRKTAAPPEDPAPLELAGFLPYALHVTAAGVSRLFASTYERRFGLGIPEWRVLAQLGEATRPTTEVIALTAMDAVKVSRAVTRLVDKGLAAKEPHPEDQRAQMLRLTPAGQAVYREIVPAARALLEELCEGMPAGERRALLEALSRLRARAAALDAARDPA